MAYRGQCGQSAHRPSRTEVAVWNATKIGGRKSESFMEPPNREVVFRVRVVRAFEAVRTPRASRTILPYTVCPDHEGF